MPLAPNRAVSEMSGVMTRVAEGPDLSLRTADCMTSIERGVQRVTDAMQGISDSANEQSPTTQDISRRSDAAARMSEGTSVAAGQTSQVAHELDQLASSLIAEMNKIHL